MNYPAETELTGSRLLRIWWALAWRTAALGGLLALLTPRLVASRGGGGMPWLNLVNGLLYGLISLGVLRSVLNKRFRDFSLRLVKEG
jgi:hypothetical protein